MPLLFFHFCLLFLFFSTCFLFFICFAIITPKYFIFHLFNFISTINACFNLSIKSKIRSVTRGATNVAERKRFQPLEPEPDHACGGNVAIQTKSSRAKIYFAAILGNLLEHYDKALYTFLAPFIIPFFFQTTDVLTSLMIAFIPTGWISRPLGALFFGAIGDRFGRKKSLFITMMGMAAVTCLMGSLPKLEACKFAPYLLLTCRCLQDFFSAGERTGSALFLLENVERKKRSLSSSFYETSSIAGYLLASLMVTLFCSLNWVSDYWRVLFWCGSLLGIVAFFVRAHCEETEDFRTAPVEKLSLKGCYGPFFAIIGGTAFSYAIYMIAVPFLTNFLPLISSLSKVQAMQANTWRLFLDFLFLPFFGWLATLYSKEKVMSRAVQMTFFLSIPLFILLPFASSMIVIIIQAAFVLFGVAFAAPYQHWVQEAVPIKQRYRIIGLAKAIGAEIGIPAASIGFWLYGKTGFVWAPAIYLMVTASGAMISLSFLSRREASTSSLSTMKVT